jgi:uridylate kinase
MQCDALFKGTSVDGIYSADPKKDPAAKRYDKLSYMDVLAQDLKVMDASAVALMRDNNIPIVVFSIKGRGNLLSVLGGGGVHTVVSNDRAA